uniref:Uncharacterized protein n=1 Tax=Varanus komodoensis TaxID=61221 RepID=A0A8D2IG45_VARKO
IETLCCVPRNLCWDGEPELWKMRMWLSACGTNYPFPPSHRLLCCFPTLAGLSFPAPHSENLKCFS